MAALRRGWPARDRHGRCVRQRLDLSLRRRPLANAEAGTTRRAERVCRTKA